MSTETCYVFEEIKSNKNFDEILIDLKDKVDKLFLFRDHYFENHPIDKAIDKDADIKKKLDEILVDFNECEEKFMSGLTKAQFWFLKGKALNVMPKYDPCAAQLLSKSLKLNPSLIEAWNELGECYWKDNNLLEAKDCFNRVSSQKNKISLRNMSIILRQEVYATTQERQQNIEKSVELAKDAVRLDPKDGVSWSLLGNAYLCSFFVVGQDPVVLKLCMSSYKQAINDPIARGQSDLHYNRAVALKYEEEYLNALESFQKASSFDPTWVDPPSEKEKLITYLDTIDDYIKTKGKMKDKKIQQMIQQLDSKQLGPYADGKYKSSKHTVTLDLLPMKEAKANVNHEKVILGKVVCSVRNENFVPFTFCMIDANETCVAVTIYNLADGKGVIIGDSVAIPEPYFTYHEFSYNDKDYKFPSIRVDNPMVMVVNSKKVGKNQIAGTRIISSTK